MAKKGAAMERQTVERQTTEKKLILFLDSGDTLVDESTEVRDDEDIVVDAELIPGAAEAVRRLHAEGYRLALVADGMAQSFKNVLGKHGIWDLFEAKIVSELIGVTKPDAKMFRAALGAMGLTDADAGRVAMVGNNLARDIRGANGVGLISVHQAWTPRYPKTPSDEAEVPDYVIRHMDELPELADRLNRQLQDGEE